MLAEIKKHHRYQNNDKTMDCGVCNRGSAIFLIAVYNRQNWSGTCIGIVNDMIVESKLLGGIDLNECNLDYKLGNGDVKLMWCKTFYPHKDMMKNGLALYTLQQLWKLGKNIYHN